MLESPSPDRLLFAREILELYSVTDRTLRQWVTDSRFPAPDGNIAGRNVWLESTVRQHRVDLFAGKFRQSRLPRGSAAKMA